MEEKTPGSFASATLSGKGLSHLSGFHSAASSPQISLLRFALRMEMMTFVPFLMGRDVISSLPPSSFMGFRMGKTVSLTALREIEYKLVRIIKNEWFRMLTLARRRRWEGASAGSRGRRRQGKAAPWASHNQDLDRRVSASPRSPPHEALSGNRDVAQAIAARVIRHCLLCLALQRSDRCVW